MPALANEIRERLEILGLNQQDVDVLMSVDSGNEVGFDGWLNHGAVTYFEALTKGRNSKTVVNWCVVKCSINRIWISADSYNSTHGKQKGLYMNF
jgi:hypothetical protein